MHHSPENSLILNYHDACIYDSDLQLIESRTEWLNDSCINFQLVRLYHQKRNKLMERMDDKEIRPVIFVDPSVVSYMMYQCDDEDLIDLGNSWRSEFLEQNSNYKEATVFLPVNDNNAAGTDAFRVPGGGNHWSMLVIILTAKHDDKFSDFSFDISLHFDSCNRSNEEAAKYVVAKASKVLNYSPKCCGVCSCPSPQQNNGYDCGIFALGVAEALSKQSLPASSVGLGIIKYCEQELARFVEDNGGVKFATNMRAKIASDIRTLAKEKSSKCS